MASKQHERIKRNGGGERERKVIKRIKNDSEPSQRQDQTVISIIILSSCYTSMLILITYERKNIFSFPTTTNSSAFRKSLREFPKEPTVVKVQSTFAIAILLVDKKRNIDKRIFNEFHHVMD